jgi:hypothetical protein
MQIMKRQKDWSGIFYASALLFPLLFLVFSSCSRSESAEEIVQNVIDKIDKLETISYKQDMWRSDPANVEDSIFRYREMIFKRLTLRLHSRGTRSLVPLRQRQEKRHL